QSPKLTPHSAGSSRPKSPRSPALERPARTVALARETGPMRAADPDAEPADRATEPAHRSAAELRARRWSREPAWPRSDRGSPERRRKLGATRCRWTGAIPRAWQPQAA